MKKSVLAFTTSLVAFSINSSAFAVEYTDFHTKIEEIANLFEKGESVKACSDFSAYQSERAEWIAKVVLNHFTTRNIEYIMEEEQAIVDHCSGGETTVEKAAEAARDAFKIYSLE